MASMTMSQSARSSRPRRAAGCAPCTSACCSAVTLPFSTPFGRKPSILPSPFFRTSSVDLAHDDLVPGLGADLRDARAHQAAADHADFLDLSHRPSSSLDDHRDSLAAADARGGEAVARLAAPQLEHQGQQQPRAGGAQRMAERDGAAVDVGALAVEAELLLDREVLARRRPRSPRRGRCPRARGRRPQAPCATPARARCP